MEILKTENLTKIYGEGANKVIALDNVSFSVNKGEFVAIVGASRLSENLLCYIYLEELINQPQVRYM